MFLDPVKELKSKMMHIYNCSCKDARPCVSNASINKGQNHERSIITIDQENARLWLCIPNCPEGALQIIDNKARLISDLFAMDSGLFRHCPEGAITIEEREAEITMSAKS